MDVEFASDGKDLYLLQCRPQSYSTEAAPLRRSPGTFPERQVLFSANRYISNGRIPDITHVVYVDPDEYAELAGALRRSAGRGPGGGAAEQAPPEAPVHPHGAGSMGEPGRHPPGRQRDLLRHQQHRPFWWRSPKKNGNYVPDLSFGTHFFQDLVEAQIRYLPLYPDEDENVLNEAVLQGWGEPSCPDRPTGLCGHSPTYGAGDRRAPGGRRYESFGFS